jgi:hypothetical protein
MSLPGAFKRGRVTATVGAVAAAIAAGSLLFAAPAQANPTKNVVLRNAPAGTNSAQLRYFNAPRNAWEIKGCFRVSSGGTFTGVHLPAGRIWVQSFTDASCGAGALRASTQYELSGGAGSLWWVDVP